MKLKLVKQLNNSPSRGTDNPMVRDSHQPIIGALVGLIVFGVSSVSALSASADTYAADYTYSIIYDDNVVSNMPTDVNDGKAVGGSFSLANNTPARSGYKFLGWCNALPSNENNTDSCSGTTYQPEASITIASAANFHFYAMWKEDVQTIQAFAKSGTCSTMSNGDTATVVDARDGEEYLVGKLADNKCWMLDNLRLDPTALSQAELYGSDSNKLTNASNTTLGYLKNGGGSSPYTGTAVANKTSGFTQYDTPNVNVSYKSDDATVKYGSGSGKVGVYYNFCAASAGSYCYGPSSSTGNASEDICPAGWRLPTSGSSGEYKTLYDKYSGASEGKTVAFRNALSTSLSGYFYNSSQRNLDSYGSFWSSTRDDSTYMYHLYVNTSNVSPASSYDRFYGYSIRCVAQ